VNKANSIVFVAGNNVINAYGIGSSGALSLLTSNTTDIVEDAVAIDISPDGQWLLGLDARGTPLDETLIDEYEISSNGVLTPGPANGTAYPHQASQGPLEPSAIKFAPSGQLVFVALGTAGDLVYTFTTATGTGTLTQNQAIPMPNLTTADLALAVSSSSSYVYFARSSGTAGSVVTYSISGTTVALVPVSTVSAGDRPSSVVVNTAGSNVYVADQFDGTIYGYSGAATGSLSQLGSSPYLVGSDPTALAVDNSGAYLLAAFNAASGNNLGMYSYDSSGNLVSSTSLNAGSGPVGIVATH
jgi:6-phosphogluconolactonase (cycloisomerase 2 family)